MFGVQLNVCFVAAMSICIGAVGAQAQADLPADQTVSYRIYEVPNDASSDPVFLVTLHLHASEMNGSSVGWQVIRATFESLSDEVLAGPVWKKRYPSLNTSDGLWWVTHADPNTPDIEEFDEAPYIEGYAQRVTETKSGTFSDDARLYFEFESYAYTGSSQPFTHTASSSAYLLVEEEDEPEVEINNEPVELEPENSPTAVITR